MSLISSVNQSLESGVLNREDIRNIQSDIVEKVSNSFYSSWSPAFFGVFYNFRIAQIFHLSFYYDFENKQIKCNLNKKLIDSDYIDKRELDQKIIKKIHNFNDCEFLLIDPIEENHGPFMYAKQSAGKVRLFCKETVNPKLKQVVESALHTINKSR